MLLCSRLLYNDTEHHKAVESLALIRRRRSVLDRDESSAKRIFRDTIWVRFLAKLCKNANSNANINAKLCKYANSNANINAKLCKYADANANMPAKLRKNAKLRNSKLRI